MQRDREGERERSRRSANEIVFRVTECSFCSGASVHTKEGTFLSST